MPQRAFRIAYDGTPFHGFQRQPDVRTVEGELLDALSALDISETVPADYSAAGRTDAGVSAAAQVVTFSCPEWCTPVALNGVLPEAIRVWAMADVEAFHATHDAIEREYVYVLEAAEIDPDRLFAAADGLSGEHDFHNLTPDETGTVRDLAIDCERDGEFILVAVRAGGFPRQLVRRLVSLLRAVGTGAAPPAKLDRVLAPERLEGPDGIPPAPPHPLFLADVTYRVSFDVVDGAADATRATFTDNGRDYALRARHSAAVAHAIPPDD